MIEKIKLNWKAGITVSLISIPLSIALAVASNTTPSVGILTAIWAGLFAAVFGGSHFNIVGPTGALSGVIASYVILHGADSLPMVAITTGLIIFISYLLKLERFLIFIPASVIHGFTLGVAFIIGLGQMNAALGLRGLPVHESFIGNIIESLSNIGHISLPAISIFTVFIIGLFLFKKFFPKLPGAIILAPIGVLLGYLTTIGNIPLNLETLGNKFGDIQFQIFNLPSFAFSFDILNAAAVIALIAILETMLSAKIADNMTKTKYNERKEMFGLSLANIASGCAGGMPATAALARTSLNIKTGATSRVSGIINVLCILIFSTVLIKYFKFMPMVVIAAILVYVAIQMVHLNHFSKLFKYEKSGLVVSLLVALLVIVKDPIIGILFGVAVSLLIYVHRITKGLYEMREDVIPLLQDSQSKEVQENRNVLIYSFRGRITYMNAKAHLSRFERGMDNYTVIILRFREVYYIDLDGIEALDEIMNLCEARGQKIILTSVSPEILEILKDTLFHYQNIQEQNLIFPKTQDVLTHLHIPLREYQNNSEHK